MHVLIISGARNVEGQTARAHKALAAGVEDAGGTTDTVYLPTLSLESCRQCRDDGWGDCIALDRCVIQDNLASLVERIREADAVVFSTPVYFGDLAESMKRFIDRFRRVTRHDVGRERVAGKPAVGVCVAGGGGGGAAHCCLALEQALHHIGFDVIDLIPVRRQNLDYKTETLTLTGRWLAKEATHE